ncbi:SAC domain-containing protein [Trichostrongylus colubriformis]|uniref:Phosphatidylinositol-3-phosphatase SAC1 n=1 Tax=Trichostrongylus colubriformis TaxID=6319 RepID=A0AAN8F4Z6_TRICO
MDFSLYFFHIKLFLRLSYLQDSSILSHEPHFASIPILKDLVQFCSICSVIKRTGANFSHMSVREVRIWRRSDARQTPAIMLEKNGIDGALMLQNGSIAALDSAAAEVEKRGYTKVMDSYGLMGVLRITRDEHVLVVVTGVLSVGQLYGADIVKIISCELISLRAVGSVEFLDPRIVDLQRLLSSGIFYYSANPRYDITSCAQRRCASKESDSRFFWNRTLHFPFERFGIDSCQWLLKCIVG